MFVAELVRTDDGNANLIYFNKTEDFKKAQKRGFENYPGYSIDQSEHKNVLISFLKRIPPRSRKDFDRFLNSLRINPDMKEQVSDFALLGYSRASLPSDEFTLIHPFCNAAPPFEFLTPVQGYEYYLKNMPYENMAEGLEITFKPEPTNAKDSKAIAMQIDGKTVGYICRGLLESFHRWLDAGYTIAATIGRINGTPENPKAFAFVTVRQ